MKYSEEELSWLLTSSLSPILIRTNRLEQKIAFIQGPQTTITVNCSGSVFWPWIFLISFKSCLLRWLKALSLLCVYSQSTMNHFNGELRDLEVWGKNISLSTSSTACKILYTAILPPRPPKRHIKNAVTWFPAWMLSHKKQANIFLSLSLSLSLTHILNSWCKQRITCIGNSHQERIKTFMPREASGMAWEQRTSTPSESQPASQ